MASAFWQRLARMEFRLQTACLYASHGRWLVAFLTLVSELSASATWAHVTGERVVQIDAVCPLCHRRRFAHVSGVGCTNCSWRRWINEVLEAESAARA